MQREKVQLVIVGGGVVGCAVARELSGIFDDIFVIEKNLKITGENQSSRNSGVIHAGVYYPKDIGRLKGMLCVEGNKLMYEFCQQYDVPFAKVGKLIVANRDYEIPYLEDTLKIAQANGVPDATMISREQALEMESNICCMEAAHFPTSGIVEATSFVYRLYSLAVNGGVKFLFGREVTGIEPVRGGFSMTVASKGNTETFDAGMVINSAGLYSDEVARMVDPEFPHEIIPFRGEAAKFYKSRRPEIYHRGMNVYPTPFPVYLDGKIARDIPIQEFHRLFSQGKMLKTVGVHLSPTFSLEKNRYVVGDTVTIGPLQKRVGSKDDYSKDLFPEEKFLEDIKPIFPGLRLADISLHQAGIQAKIKGHYDFVIEKCRKHPAFVTLAGIDSPGLTASLAIAKYVKELILN